MGPRPGRGPPPDPDAEPAGFIVVADGDVRLHFHDWGGPAPTRRSRRRAAPAGSPPAGLVVGAGRAAARARGADGRRRPARPGPVRRADGRATTSTTLAADAVAVAEGSGLLARRADRAGAGHGFGALVAAAAAEVLADRCAGLVLVDGGWERIEVTTEVDVDEFLRGLDEPPEVMRSMDAWLADRRGFDPATWDADQERPPATRSSRRPRATWSAPSGPTWSRPSCGRCSRRTRSRRWPRSRRPWPRWSRWARATTARASRSCAGAVRRAARRGPVADPARGLPGGRPQPDALPPGRGRPPRSWRSPRRERRAVRRQHSAGRPR